MTLELLDFAAARCSVGLLTNGRLVTNETSLIRGSVVATDPVCETVKPL